MSWYLIAFTLKPPVTASQTLFLQPRIVVMRSLTITWHQELLVQVPMWAWLWGLERPRERGRNSCLSFWTVRGNPLGAHLEPDLVAKRTLYQIFEFSHWVIAEHHLQNGEVHIWKRHGDCTLKGSRRKAARQWRRQAIPAADWGPKRTRGLHFPNDSSRWVESISAPRHLPSKHRKEHNHSNNVCQMNI